MGMPYSTNPNLPRVRMQAVRLLAQGWSTREAARHLGYTQSAVVKRARKARSLPSNVHVIPTESSRPHHHPHELTQELVAAILTYRKRHRRCAEVLHHLLVRDGYQVSLVSVKRTLQRHQLTRYSRWKKWHTYPPRPRPEMPGALVEIDTILDGAPTERLCVYTLLDVCSRWAYASPILRISTHTSLRFVEQARFAAPFPFRTVQSDHGSEFSKWFTQRLGERGVAHRHSRVRTPNDNAHLERFNRTLQEECLERVPRRIEVWRREIPEYLRYYNESRPHMGLDMKTPNDILKAIPSY